ncbi:unnamed protein product, partial [Mesorhabditis belari]|uniref:Partial AB-hydrolase lipase domain-containing protein n=1 Tax=Mesorhabditis belari TaxID=2138241 RepID=A0AAF3FQE9_9BILA
MKIWIFSLFSAILAFPTEFPPDPELELDFLGIAKRWDYYAEEHFVTTDDGYILRVHRIPNKRFQTGVPNCLRPTVFLQHGMEGSSASWILNLPDQSAGFVFADAGFDVWIGNFRGNVYAKNHTKLDPTSHEFWQFSWDQMGSQDLPAMLKYVIGQTGAQQLYYVAHSMGTMAAFAEFSHNHDLEALVREFYALGPVASVAHIKGLLAWMADRYQLIQDLLDVLGIDQFLPPSFLTEIIAEDVCEDADTYKVCDNLLFLISGTSQQLNETRVPVYLNHMPAAAENQKHYGQPVPPEYHVEDMTLPVHLYWGYNDTLADPQDVQMAPPAIYGEPKIISADGNVTLEVVVTGADPVKTKWLLGDRELEESDNYVFSHSDEGGNRKKLTCLIKEFDKPLAGEYKAKFFSADGENSAAFTVTVGDAPEFHDKPHIVQRDGGNVIVIKVRAKSHLEMKAEWFKDDKPVKCNDRVKAVVKKDDKDKDGYQFLLEITGPIKEDEAKYKCVVKNSEGQNQQTYNCEAVNVTSEEWAAKGKKDPILGSIFLTYGIIVELMYVPCLMVITRPQYLKLSCYKIMAILGVIDMAAIVVNSVLTGIFMIEGAVYCSHPDLIYISGAIGLGLWCCACLSCLLLVVNRLVDIWKPHLMDGIFGGRRTYYVMTFPMIYGLYFVFFTQPLCFSSSHAAWFFSPFIYEESRDPEYLNYPHTANNLLIVVATCWLYTGLCYILASKFKTDYSSGMSWTQKSIFIQATLICLANLIAALIYVYMQFFPTPDVFILIGHINWQWGHGFPAIVYLALNRTIQREVGHMLGLYKINCLRTTKILPSASAPEHTSSLHI